MGNNLHNEIKLLEAYGVLEDVWINVKRCALKENWNNESRFIIFKNTVLPKLLFLEK